MLSYEGDKSEQVWSYAEYINPEEVAEAFSLKDVLSYPEGIAAHQLNPYEKNSYYFFKLSLLFIAILIAVQIAFSLFMPHPTEISFRFLHQGEAGASVGAVGKTISTQAFEFKNETANLDIMTTCEELNNQWLDVGIDLVEENTGHRYVLTHGLGFYSGHDNDGYWSEGSKSTSSSYSNIPPGKYHLEVESSGNARVGAVYLISLNHGELPKSNFFLGLIALILPIGFVFWRKAVYENQRWEEADFNSSGIAWHIVERAEEKSD